MREQDFGRFTSLGGDRGDPRNFSVGHLHVVKANAEHNAYKRKSQLTAVEKQN